MSFLARLFAPLGRLFPRPAARRRFQPLDLGGGQATPAAQPAPLPVVPPVPTPVPEPVPAASPRLEPFPPLPDDAATVEVEDEEETFEEEERADDADADADSEAGLDERPDLDVLVAERHARLDDTRREAEQLALEGEQRVRLTDPAGPGTLAETLARLEREGRVISVLADDDGEPVLVYTPVGEGSAPAAH